MDLDGVDIDSLTDVEILNIYNGILGYDENTLIGACFFYECYCWGASYGYDYCYGATCSCK